MGAFGNEYSNNSLFYLELWSWPWSNMRSAHRLMVLYICAKSFQNVTNLIIILEMCAELFVNPKKGSKDIKHSRKHDGQTDNSLFFRFTSDRDKLTTHYYNY